ncbi:MAG: murein biosynthesis integral membrane protein MurJ [Pseudomonadota bacterium]
MSKKPFRSTLVVGGMTFISRIFGYARDAIIFIVFGANAGTDAFFVAFRLPNFLRRIFAEGAFSQAFVPVLTSHLNEGEPQFKRLIDHMSGLLTLVLIILTIIGIIFSQVLIYIFAPGFDDPAQEVLASDMLKITAPYLLFISLTAMAASILNIRHRFAVPAFTPVLLNLSLIGAAIWLAPKMEEPITALAWGVLIAGVAQLLFQLPFLARVKGLPTPRLSGATAGVKRTLKLMLPAIFGSSIVQINLLVDTMIASFLVAGSISWLYISDRFVELPLALFGIATATVILPMLSKQHVAKEVEQFNSTLQWAMKLSLLIAIPSMLGLIVLASPILSTLVQYREFSAFDTQMASLSLMAYAFGLPAFIFIKVLAPGFYSRQDTKTPVKIGVVAMLINIMLNLFFLWLWRYLELPGAHAGLALATSLSAYVNATLLFILLKRSQVIHRMQAWTSIAMKVILSSVIMVSVLFWLIPNSSAWSAWGTYERFGYLLGFIALGAIIYGSILFTLGIRVKQFRPQI